MKKILLFLTVILLGVHSMYAVVTWDGTSSEMWTQGTGTEADPYLIETPANLAYLSAQVTAGETYAGVYFQQTEDFDLQSKTWTPIGTSTYKFAGIYNGANKYVSNIKTNQYGLFGITENTKIKNVVLKGTFSASSSYAPTSAPLIGEAQGTTEIINCHNYATTTNACAGLIVSATGNSISLYNCSNHANINSTAYSAGGLIAHVNTSTLTLESCYNEGLLKFYNNSSYNETEGSYQIASLYCGGLIGKVFGACISTLKYCYNIGDISAGVNVFNLGYIDWTKVRLYAAGLVGYNASSNNGLLMQCYHIASVSTGMSATGSTKYLAKNVAGLVNGNCDIIGCFVRTNTNMSSSSSTDSYAATTTCVGNLLGGKVSESCYAIGTGNLPEQSSNVFHNSSNSTGGIYKSDATFKSPTIVPLLNTMGEYFTMDLEGINDGYPILTWQAGPRFTITGSCDANRGTVKGGGEYAPGNTVTLTATPKKGCTFVGWSDGVTDNPRTVTVEGDATYRAQFIKSSYTIYVNQDCTNYIE